MKILCDCGYTIYDQTDCLSYKAHFIADQDSFDLYDDIDKKIRKLVLDIEHTTSNKIAIEEAVERTMTSVHDAISDYARRPIYQCSGCGRLFVDDAKFNTHVFIPKYNSGSKNLMCSIKGDEWKFNPD